MVEVNVQKECWSPNPVSMMEGDPFCVNGFMSHARFGKIITELTYTDDFPPLLVDKLWEAIHKIRDLKYYTK